MRIGLYGLPCAGKSFIMDEVKNFEVCAGSKRLLEINPDFHSLTAEEQNNVRLQFADELKSKDGFIVDGHYAFGCTLPNSVVKSKKPLSMVININGNEITYNIRK